MDARIPSLNLVMQSGPQAGQVFTISASSLVFGRGAGSDIVIADKSLSRQHARIKFTSHGFIIEDLGSTNGTFVNDRQVTVTALICPGDTIRLGEAVVLLVQPAATSVHDDRATVAVVLSPSQPLMPVPRETMADDLVAQPPYAPVAARSSGLAVWLVVGLVVLIAALSVGAALTYLYYKTQASPAAVVAGLPSTPGSVSTLPPAPLATVPPPTAILPEASPTPAPTVPPPTPALPGTEQTPTTLPPSPTLSPVPLPGIPAAVVPEQVAPVMANPVDPFCGRQVEVMAGAPVFINWQQRTALPEQLGDWLSAASYDITLDGRPVGLFYYQRQPGPLLNWWAELGALSPGQHYVRIQQYTSRPVSTGLDLQPSDGQVDVLGPGPAGGGFCEINVLAPTPTSVPPSATPVAPPTSPPAAAGLAPAPLGVFVDFETPISWKRGDEPYGELTRSSAMVYSGSYAGQVAYTFPSPNNDYVVFKYSRALAGRPNAISAWVYGDGAGHYLNLWLKDAGGQTWQMSFGQVQHTGWREMTALLDPAQPWPVGSVSGANNGLVDYPVSFQALVLDDAPDSYTGSGLIYLDDLASRDVVVLPTPTPAAPVPVGQPAPAPAGGYSLAVGKHIYEPWGAARGGDICEAYNRHDFDDRVRMKGFNIELLLTNNSSIPVGDGWVPAFTTAKGKSVQVCYYEYWTGQGTGVQPKATGSVTFFTIIEPDDYVRIIQLTINGQFIQMCLDPGGAPSGC